MRFLIDESVSPIVAQQLTSAGHDASHVHHVGLTGAADPLILERAATDDRVLVTLDTDFSALMAQSGSLVPSVILFRGAVTRRPLAQVELLLANLDHVTEDLEAGAIVVIGDDRVRVRRLPVL